MYDSDPPSHKHTHTQTRVVDPISYHLLYWRRNVLAHGIKLLLGNNTAGYILLLNYVAGYVRLY